MKVELYIEDSDLGIEMTFKYVSVEDVGDSLYHIKEIVLKAKAKKKKADASSGEEIL